MEKFHRYLVQLGLDVPTEMPPIGTTKRAKTSLVVHPAPIYEGYTYIPEKSLDDPTEAHRVYARYCFPFLLDALRGPSGRQDNRGVHILELFHRQLF